MIWSTRKQYYFGLWAFLQHKYVFKKYMLKWRVCTRAWVNSYMPITELCPVHIDAILREYEIIMLNYNGRPCRLDLFNFGVCKEIILQAIHHKLQSLKEKLLNTNWSKSIHAPPPPDDQLSFPFLWFTLTNYLKHFHQSICREFMSPVGYFYLKKEFSPNRILI